MQTPALDVLQAKTAAVPRIAIMPSHLPALLGSASGFRGDYVPRVPSLAQQFGQLPGAARPNVAGRLSFETPPGALQARASMLAANAPQGRESLLPHPITAGTDDPLPLRNEPVKHLGEREPELLRPGLPAPPHQTLTPLDLTGREATREEGGLGYRAGKSPMRWADPTTSDLYFHGPDHGSPMAQDPRYQLALRAGAVPPPQGRLNTFLSKLMPGLEPHQDWQAREILRTRKLASWGDVGRGLLPIAGGLGGAVGGALLGRDMVIDNTEAELGPGLAANIAGPLLSGPAMTMGGIAGGALGAGSGMLASTLLRPRQPSAEEIAAALAAQQARAGQ